QVDTDSYEYMGEGIKDITGYPVSEFSFSFWKSITIEIDMGRELTGLSLDEVHNKLRRGEIKRLVMDMKIRTKSDEIRWIRDMTTALYDGSGVCNAIFGIFFDITDRKLVEEELRLKKDEMQKDLDMAREVQMALLSQNYPKSFPENVPEEQGALHFSHRYIPAATLAGDFFEILPISNHQAGIMIYDVMGHGVRASLLTAYLHGLVEELMPIAADPVIFMKRLNAGLSAIMEQFLTGMFATAFYLVADIKKGKMFYTNAGHPKPYLLKRNNGNVERLEHNKKLLEPALGLFDKYDYTVSECSMNNDDIVLLFTDGIYEVENAELDMFGEKQLQQIVKDKLSNTPEVMLDAIIKEINNFAGKTEFSDDVCMVSMHVRKSTL
ncbi:SpoIIE family protein phosphatase, partial [Fibrobacterota bacterium]